MSGTREDPAAQPTGHHDSPPDKKPSVDRKARTQQCLGRLLTLLGGVVALIALAVGALFAAVQTERGSRYLWNTAVKLLDGRLSGRWEGGTLAHGVRLSDLRWRSKEDDIRVSRIDGQWALTFHPWCFTIDFLHINHLDLRLAPSPSPQPTALPGDLSLPLPIDLRSLRIDRIVLHNGPTVTELADLALSARSDGRSHRLALDAIKTPAGTARAALTLDGARPFKLTGEASLLSKIGSEAVQIDAHLSGSLAALAVDIDANGKQLGGRAHIEAAPFTGMPLKVATLAADHLNPQTFFAGAPMADLALRAELRPVAVGGTKKGAPGEGPFTIAGPVSMTNAKPGALDAHRLPLLDARANLRINAITQSVSDLMVRLTQNATLTGSGKRVNGAGRFDLRVAQLDLHALAAALRPTQLAGRISIAFERAAAASAASAPSAAARTVITAELADPRQAMRARAGIRLDAASTTLDSMQLQIGSGSAQLSGSLQKDAKASYAFKAALTSFDPLALLANQSKPGAAARHGGKGMRRGGSATVTRVSGTFNAQGALARKRLTLRFALNNSLYRSLPLTGGGTLQLAGKRLLSSDAKLSIAGNEMALAGSFGGVRDRLRFRVDAPHLDQLGFGLGGALRADGEVNGTLARPNIIAHCQADRLALGEYRAGHLQGHAEWRAGANGALNMTLNANDMVSGAADGMALTTLNMRIAGTRASHTFTASALGALRGQLVDADIAGHGRLSERRRGIGWDGTITALHSRGIPTMRLNAPLAVSAAPQHLALGATQLTIEGASLTLQNLSYDHGQIRSAGTLTGVELKRILQRQQELAGKRGGQSPVNSDLVLDGRWDIAVDQQARGFLEISRRSGDVSILASGNVPLGITQFAVRAAFSNGNQLDLTAQAEAARVGVLQAALHTRLMLSARREGLLVLADHAPLSGAVEAKIPQLKTMGALFGPQYLLNGRLAMKLAVGGVIAKPELSGELTGDDLSVTLVDESATLKRGTVRIALSQNRLDFRQVEFHGISGTLRVTGGIQLDQPNSELAATIVADKLELFATPNRQLSLSGRATVAHVSPAGGRASGSSAHLQSLPGEGAYPSLGGGPAGRMAINGKFVVDHARFDLPDKPAPKLESDVVIAAGERQITAAPGGGRPVSRFAPWARVAIDLGNNFRFHGLGADLLLHGALTVTSAPNQPLRAIGNIRVEPGSIYRTFGRKLDIENGYFTFNGPINNPGINILAMRRNQPVEAGVRVTGTLQKPNVQLVSEPNRPDDEKLSWLLFGHGTDSGINLGQQSTMNAAVALLGAVGSKRVAQTLGVDELSIGPSEAGLPDPQVILLAKALNEWLILGYEQGIKTTATVFKITWQITRYWALTMNSGTLNGVDLLFNRRFD